jgi:hypothetical protein
MQQRVWLKYSEGELETLAEEFCRDHWEEFEEFLEGLEAAQEDEDMKTHYLQSFNN